MFIFGWINNLLGIGGGGSLNPKKRFFLGQLGAGSGANNSIDFTVPVIIKPSLKLVRASAQGASILNAAQTGLGLTGDFVIQGPVNLASLTGDFDLIDKWDGTGNQRSYIVRITNGGSVYLYASADGAAVGSASVNYQFVVGTEVNVAVKYTASTGTMKLLINGVSVGTATGTLPTSIFNSTAPVSIGILSGAGTNAFDGKIKSLYVYNAAIADATILANVTAATPSATSLVAQWDFNGNLQDSTANANHLTAIGTPTYPRPFSIGWWGYVSNQEQRMSICGNQTLVNSGNISFYNTSRIIFIKSGGANTTITHTANFEDQFGYIEIKSDDNSLVTTYFNGTSVGSATVTGTFIINRVMGGPNNSTTTFGYSGGFKDFKIYNEKLLSAGESLTNKNGGHVPSGCALWYKCNEKSGTSVADYSGNARTGTISDANAYFFQEVKSLTNLLSNSGFNVFGGSFPNEVPTGWVPAGVRTSDNYITNSDGRVLLVGDGTNIGLSYNNVLTQNRNYKAILNIENIYATTLLTSNGTRPSNGQTVTLGATVYTFKTTLASAYDILIDPDATESIGAAKTLDNLKSAVNATAGEGTTYGTGTLIHPDVTATTNTDTTQIFVAKVIGEGGLSIVTTDTSANLSFTGATMGFGTVYFYSMGGVTSLVMNPMTVAKGQNSWNFTAGSTTAIGWLRGSGSFPDNLLSDNMMLFEI